jgi:hypothetical protein
MLARSQSLPQLPEAQTYPFVPSTPAGSLLPRQIPKGWKAPTGRIEDVKTYNKYVTPDKWWYMRHSNPSKPWQEVSGCWYDSDPFSTKCFKADQLKHCSATFGACARKEHKYDPETLKLKVERFKEDKDFRQDVTSRYNELMKKRPATPGKPFFTRCHSTIAL